MDYPDCAHLCHLSGGCSNAELIQLTQRWGVALYFYCTRGTANVVPFITKMGLKDMMPSSYKGLIS